MTYRALFKFDKLSENAKTEYDQNVETFLMRIWRTLSRTTNPPTTRRTTEEHSSTI